MLQLGAASQQVSLLVEVQASQTCERALARVQEEALRLLDDA